MNIDFEKSNLARYWSLSFWWMKTNFWKMDFPERV